MPCRTQIVAGQAEPTDAELEGFDEGLDNTSTAGPGAAAPGGKVPQGVPFFWLTVLSNQVSDLGLLEQQSHSSGTVTLEPSIVCPPYVMISVQAVTNSCKC